MATVLLESGDTANSSIALNILDQVLVNPEGTARQQGGLIEQWIDADSTLPFDANMLSFNMSLALCIYYRQGHKLTAPLRSRLFNDLHRISQLVIRRDVSIYYTNIALLDLFILLAASELQKDPDIIKYADLRMNLVKDTILSPTGGFAEYLSPTYTSLDVTTVTMMKMFLALDSHAVLARALHDKLWKHIANHWHAPTRQIAGPMSRAYGDRVGPLLWLQKALNNRLCYQTIDQITFPKFNFSEWSTSLLEYECPEDLVSTFLVLEKPKQVREVFCPNHAIEETADEDLVNVRPVQGTSYLTPQFCLSTVNQSDLWYQRRPLMLYWGDAIPPGPGICKLQMLKDGRDFASAQSYSVQEESSVLAIVNFVTPGGDTAPRLSGLPTPFPMKTLEFSFSVAHWSPTYEVLINGRATNPRQLAAEDFPPVLPTRFSWRTGTIQCCLSIVSASFGRSTIGYSLTKTQNSFQIRVSLFAHQQTQMIRWEDISPAYVCYSLKVEGVSRSLASFDDDEARHCAAGTIENGIGSFKYGRLNLLASTFVRTLTEQDQIFKEVVNGEPVPLNYLGRVAG